MVWIGASPQGDTMVKQKEQTEQTTTEEQTLLVGYVRRSNAGGAIKVSINASAFEQCSTYVTADGESYVPLVISIGALERVLSGERAVTTISQFKD